MKFKQLKPYDSFYHNGFLCFKLDYERYISPRGTHRMGDLNTEVKTKRYYGGTLIEAYKEYRT